MRESAGDVALKRGRSLAQHLVLDSRRFSKGILILE